MITGNKELPATLYEVPAVCQILYGKPRHSSRIDLFKYLDVVWSLREAYE